MEDLTINKSEVKLPRTSEDWQDYMSEQLRAGHLRMDAIERSVAVNTGITEKTSEDVISLKKDIKTFLELQAFSRIGVKLITGLAIVGGGFATMWAALHGKIP